MTIYSYSKLRCYEQCPQKFKFRYIDRVRIEVKESIELFLGRMVHETLKKLYQDLWYQKMNSLGDLLFFLRDEWSKKWNNGIMIMKARYSSESYLRMAKKYITDYYNRYYPFDQGRIIALEKRILINLDDSGDYRLQGYIDRLAESEDGCYEIHDYKTNSRLPLSEDIQNDKQLAPYSIGIKQRFPDVKDARLIWHFLKFDKEIESTRTNEELENIKRNTIQLIDIIESAEEFSANPSRLCDWCRFKSICR